jgi:hypothetical protein
MDQAVRFLVKDLKVCTQEEVNERIFFVSAKEGLKARLLKQKGLPAHSKDNQAHKYQLLAVIQKEEKRCMDGLGHIFVILIGVDR